MRRDPTNIWFAYSNFLPTVQSMLDYDREKRYVTELNETSHLPICLVHVLELSSFLLRSYLGPSLRLLFFETVYYQLSAPCLQNNYLDLVSETVCLA